MRSRLQRLFVSLVLLFPALLRAEKVADLPLPHTYVNDFADVLGAAYEAESRGSLQAIA